MWKHRSEILTPSSSVTSKQAKWNWSKECQKAFDTIKKLVSRETLVSYPKKLVSRETLLSYPKVNEPFGIHTDASKLQLGSVICLKGKLIEFYSRKFNSSQVIYTTTERELLSIEETIKEFRNIYY